MADIAPEVKVVLTAEDQGVSQAIRQLGSELQNLKGKQDSAQKSAEKLGVSFKTLANESLSAFKVRLANLPGLGNFGSAIALRAYEPIGKELEQGATALEEIGGAALAIGGVAAAVVALGAVAAGVDDHMMHLARSIENTAFATGLTRRQVQEYNEVAKEMDVDADSLQMAMARLNTQLGEYVVLGSKSASGSEMFTKVLTEFGVQMKTAEGSARPLNAVLADFYDALQKIPDQATRTEAEMTAFGTRGRVLAQIFEEARSQGVSFIDMLHSVDATGNVLSDSQLGNLLRQEEEWERLKGKVRGFFTQLGASIAESTLSWRGFERAVATTALALGTIIPGKDVDAIVNKLLPLPASASAGSGAGTGASFLALQQIAQTNEQLAERVAVLKAGGQNQEKLKEAEAQYAAAVESHNEGLMKAYATQVADLKEIIALEAAKKHGHEQGPLEAAQKAQLALVMKQQQDEITIAKAAAEQRHQLEQTEYENGLISIAQYYSDRRKAISEGVAQEIAALEKERAQIQAAADLAGTRATAAQAREGKGTPEERQRAAAEADKFNAERLEALARIDELNTRISTAQINSATEIARLNNEQNRAEIEQKQRILDLDNQIGLASEKQFEDRAGETGESIEAVQNRQTAIQIDLNDKKITAAEAEQRTKALLEQEIPLLRQKAQLELQSAMATGDPERIAQARQTILQIQQMQQETQKQKQTLGQAAGSMVQSFAQIARGAETASQAFMNMGNEMIGALEGVLEQMLVNVLEQKNIDDQTRISDAGAAARNTFKSVSAIPVVGWILAPAAAAAAFAMVMAFKEGGPVVGPAGTDRVPAMLTAGEFVMNAGAVKSFGLQNMHAINAGALSAPEHASVHDFSAPRFQAAEGIAGSAARVNNVNNEIHLHHNGPDALAVLKTQLVPELARSFRAGELDFIAP